MERPNDGRKEQLEVLCELLRGLPEPRATVIYLRYWEEMTIQQIASALGQTWSSIDFMLEESLEELRVGFARRDKQKVA